jgi:hypothetical protein
MGHTDAGDGVLSLETPCPCGCDRDSSPATATARLGGFVATRLAALDAPSRSTSAALPPVALADPLSRAPDPVPI